MKIGEKFAAKKAGDDDNMVPLINIVFLMLVFFMVAGQIRKADPIPIVPPHSINETRAANDPNVEIVVGLDDSLYVDDIVMAIEDTQSYLEEAFSTDQNQDTFWVQVKADGDIPLEKLRPIFNQIRLAGLTKVSLATQLEREAR